MSAVEERVVTFDSGGHALFGILHLPSERAELGVVILVGGPQYRVGSHRMFVQIARAFAAAGYPTLRFDFAGMGDSEGTFAGFERLDRDVAAAVDQLGAECPTLRRYALFGLCDGATAAALYASQDERITHLAMLNPWVHTVAGEAKVFLWHYYPRRLISKDFWRNVLRGKVALRSSFVDFARKLGALSNRRAPRTEGSGEERTFIDRMRQSLGAFQGRMLVILSGNDFTAAEFAQLWSGDGRWAGVRMQSENLALPEADHTLSSVADLRSCCEAICSWLQAEPEVANGDELRA